MDTPAKEQDRAGVLVYVPESDSRGHELNQMLSRVISVERIEVNMTLDSLIDNLQNPGRFRKTCIFVMARKRDLSLLLKLRSHLTGLRLILILPDCSESTVAMAHRLHPRFLSYIDSDLRPVVSVVQRLIESA